ncbi:MAG: hypothetical protein JNK32_10400 [Anaerolineales bacterium]|nr:hypothetical protein [Anaerolineales bacterium]
MNTFSKTIAAIFAVLFVITAVMALILFNFDRRAFNAETYQQAFARGDFYNALPALMAEVMSSSTTDKSQYPNVMQSMSQDAWEAFLRALLPADAMKAMSDDVLNSTFSYINLQTDSVQINLTPLKNSMAGDTGVQAVLSLVQSLPECTALQIAEITTAALTGRSFGFCNPPAELLPVLAPIVQGQLQLAAFAIPDQMTLFSAPLQDDPRLRLQSIRFFMRISPILPLLFLLGMTVLAVRSLKEWLNWWGVPLFITGVAAAILAVIGGPILGTLLSSYIDGRMQNFLPTVFLAYTSDLAAAMANALLKPVLWQGLILAAIGFGLIGVGFFVKKQ